MTPLPVITDVYRVAINWTAANGQKAENVIHVHKASSSAAAVAALIDSSVTTNMWLPVSSTVGGDTLSVTPLDGVSPTLQYANVGAHWLGGTSGAFIPQVSCVVSLATGTRGRSYRGRVFLPFAAESILSDGVMTGSTAATTQTAWTTFLTTLSGSSANLVVASYKHATAANVLTCTVQNAVGTQRRRQTRVRYP